MNENLFNAFKDPASSILGPSREFNKLTINKLEQLVSLQFSSLREYTDLNLAQLKAASNISSPEDLKEYLGKQQELLKTVGEKLAGDAQAVAALVKEYAEEAKGIAFKGFSGNGKSE